MNNGGIPYSISNPPDSTPNWVGTPGRYSTDFEISSEDKIDHFDVYGEVQTIYSQVYWTRNNPINLPPEIVHSIQDVAKRGVAAAGTAVQTRGTQQVNRFIDEGSSRAKKVGNRLID